MRRARRVARVRAVARLLVASLAATVTFAVAPAPAAAAPPESLTGTYELLATDTIDAHGDLAHHYTEVLRVPGKKAYPVTMPAGHGVRAGSRIQVSAYRTSGDRLDVRSVRRISAASATPTLGTHSVLVILAYWTRPDSVTPAIARARFFDDGDRWFKESSYGQYGITGTVTPWLKIPAPPNDRCYAGSEMLYYDARSAAASLGPSYDPNLFMRTVVYFPRCVGGDTANVAGWAYEPGSVSWLNGYLDRRTIVHEQGHNLGVRHARSHACRTLSGTPVTYSAKCSVSEYGDQFDAMGRSRYSAHYTGYRKHLAGWLGGSRKRVLPSAAPTAFTLPPFERANTRPLVVVARSPKVYTRSYWLEFRRPIGMDRYLPSGATGGVLIHVVDTAQPAARGSLLDGSPKDKTMSTAVLKSGTSWTAPDGVKIVAGAIGTSGIRVTVTGARPNPTPPSTPRYVAATARDESVTVSWQPPTSDGYAHVTHYVVRAEAGGWPIEVMAGPGDRSAVVGPLANDVRYAVTVAAVNAAGERKSLPAYVTPRLLPPSIRITSPAAGATVHGVVSAFAEATPNPVSEHRIECIEFFFGDRPVGGGCDLEDVQSAGIDTRHYPNGDHVLRVTARDVNGRVATAERVVRVVNPVPEVLFTSPKDGTTLHDVETVTLEATASVPLDPSVTVSEMRFYDLTSGYQVGVSTTAPYRAVVDVSRASGWRDYRAVATGSNGVSGFTDIRVLVEHPASTLTITEPVAGATVRGPTVRIAADAVVTAARSAPERVEFYLDDRPVAADTTAPFEYPWDTSSVTGTHRVRALLTETTGRTAWAPEVQVTVANALPDVRVTSPANGTSVPHGTVRIAGTATASAGGEAPDRVLVYLDDALVGKVTPAGDGSWWLDASAVQGGYRWLRVVAYTPGGLLQTYRGQFHVYRPLATATIQSPASNASVPVARPTDVVVAAAPAANDFRTVSEACVDVYYSGYVRERLCTMTRGADGYYHVPWTPQSTGSRQLRPFVVLNDGYHYDGALVPVTVTAL